ncbi:IS66 family insertion sequence element accessory protein TnpB [Agrobacterium radiobacter]|uniref:IS66 family insertion sequence element accessory protein TnpB n=1 Tax=Agrobacterium radiobacter TaxID=362 RepID=UPI003F87F150
MIMVPAGVKVWQATGYTDMRKGFPGLSLILQKALMPDPMCGHCSYYTVVAANDRHTAYGYRFATISYSRQSFRAQAPITQTLPGSSVA